MTKSKTDTVVRLQSVTRTYGRDSSTVVALDNVSLDFVASSFTAIMGPSGSGKSTLLNCAAGLDKPSAGSVTLGGHDLGPLKEIELTKLRRSQVGFIFQAFNLMPTLTVRENITLPLFLAGKEPEASFVTMVIEQVGLSGRQNHRPGELSGGQQQRVAIARALVTQPAVIFADEPTGALDTRTALEVLDLLRKAVDAAGQTVVMVTHDPIAASHADRVIFLADGKIVEELHKPSAKVIANRMIRLGAWEHTSDKLTSVKGL